MPSGEPKRVMTGEDLKKWRERQKPSLTQAQAAARYEQSVDAWRAWEQGKNPVPVLLSKLIQAESRK